MSAKWPLVTVGIATYNGSKYLADSLRSIISGDYPNIEILIVDDGSSDESVAIAERFDDSRLRIITNESNSGLVRTRQQIVKEAQGEYLAWLDQDDIAYPSRIATQVAFLERNERVGVCGSQTLHRVHEPSGKEWLLKTSGTLCDHEEIRASIPFICPISFNTATMRMSAFRQGALGFREEFGNSLDYELWSRAADEMELANIGKYLGEYRVHSNQTSRGSGAARMRQAAWTVQRDVLERKLGISLDHRFDHVHRRMTVNVSSLASERDAVEVGTWLRFLTERNSLVGAYKEREFERAVSRQWVLSLAHLSRKLGVSKAIKLAAASHSITGLRNKNLTHGLRSALQNQGLATVHRLINRDPR